MLADEQVCLAWLSLIVARSNSVFRLPHGPRHALTLLVTGLPWALQRVFILGILLDCGTNYLLAHGWFHVAL